MSSNMPFFFLLSLFLYISLPPVLSSPYFSPTFLPNYQNMLSSFKVFTYTPPQPLLFSTPAESFFFSSLLNSSFLTPDPEQAHLFFLPFSSSTPTRSISRLVSALRSDYPFWNRTLGADHFYVSCDGLGFFAYRNVLELKKNSVQISCFPPQRSRFIPHKDVTLPPLARPHYATHGPWNESRNYLGYVKYDAVKEMSLVNELVDDRDFVVEQQPSDFLTYEWRLRVSKFCLFQYGEGDLSGISDAVRFGCVPVVITDRPIQDLPLMDLLRWQEIAVFVGWKSGGGGVKELRRVLDRACGDESRYEKARQSCVTAGRHFVWNEAPQPFDAFHSVMYQLWLRRHTVRYARREVA